MEFSAGTGAIGYRAGVTNAKPRARLGDLMSNAVQHLIRDPDIFLSLQHHLMPSKSMGMSGAVTISVENRHLKYCTRRHMRQPEIRMTATSAVADVDPRKCHLVGDTPRVATDNKMASLY